MANIILNPTLPTAIKFVCNVAINWSAGRRRGGVITVSDSGSAATLPPKTTGTLPPNTFRSGDSLEWGVDVFGPAGSTTTYTLEVSVEQPGVIVAHTTHKGTVGAGSEQTEQGNWTLA